MTETQPPAQARDEPMRAAERELVLACKAATSDAEKVAAIDAYRAALKAQPAPTEAQGESPLKFRPWSKEAEMIEGWTAAEKAREAAQVTVTVERGGVYITKGVQSFRLAYEGETQAEKEWYAGQLRAALGQGEDSARLDAERYRYFRKIYGAGARIIRGPIYAAETPEQFDAGIDECIRYEQEVARASAETGGVKP